MEFWLIGQKMSEHVRFGIIGCGHMGLWAERRSEKWAIGKLWNPLSYARAILHTPGAELIAVCDTCPERLKEAEGVYGVQGYFTVREMIQKENLDAVCIATRTPGRAALIQEIVELGIKVILCEKPLCNSLQELNQLGDLFQDRGLTFIYGARRRFMEAYQKAREEIRKGTLGVLRSQIMQFGTARLFWGHPHTVDLAFMMNEENPVRYVQSNLEWNDASSNELRIGDDPLVKMGFIEFQNGVQTHFCGGVGCDLVLMGDEGILSVLEDGCRSVLRQKAEGLSRDLGWYMKESQYQNTDRVSGTVRSIEIAMAAIREGKKDLDASFRVAFQSQQVLFAWMESALQGGSKVRISQIRPNLQISGKQKDLPPA